MQIVVPDEFKYLYVQDDERPVLKVPADVLLQKAREIERVTKKHHVLAENMMRIMRQANGVGLAAPQVGASVRIVVMIADDRPLVLFNPKVLSATGSQIDEEGCLSIPGLYGDVERAAEVEIEALDRKGRKSTWEMDGMSARVVLHEIDHLDGILFTEKVDQATVYWQHPSKQAAAAE
ncbi:MAG: peptide deformylase [Armatimonadetes bacterium]|nr:peptide deformylase [Armatimonadota bacterium]